MAASIDADNDDDVVPALSSSSNDSPPSSPSHINSNNSSNNQNNLIMSLSSQKTPSMKRLLNPGILNNDGDSDFDFEFAVATLDLLNADRKTLISYAWSFLLGVSALLDLLSTVLPMWFVDNVKLRSTARTSSFSSKSPVLWTTDIYQLRRRPDGMIETNDPLLIDMLIWFRRHSASFGFLFSLLCFLDIFVRARRQRQHALRERDRQRLLGQRCSSNSTDNQSSLEEKETYYQWWKGAWGVYFRTVAFQLMLLPVSFYFLIYHWLHLWIEVDDSKVDDDEDVTIVIRGLQTLSGKYETFSTRTYTGLGAAILQYGILVAVRSETATIRAAVIRFAMRVFRFAVRHPKLFGSRLRTLLRGLRWGKYLAPLIGTFNKLLGNTVDLLKRYNQHRQLVRAEQARVREWNEFSLVERQTHAAVRIQCMYRAFQSRKAFAALRLLRGDKEAFAALKIQKVLRGMLARARLRLLAKEQELQMLLDKEEKIDNDDMKHMSAEDRKRIYQLEDELKMVADKLINRELLLRPNTRFSVAWRLIFVACVVFEISVLILQPRLAKFKDKKTGKPLDICRIMQDTLVPKPISTWEACAVEIEKPKKKGPGILHVVQQLVPKKKKAKNPIQPIKKVPRWYCHHYIARTHTWCTCILKWIISEFVVFLAFVSFIDVPISFFIGELDPVSGALVPKDWLTRWVFPGIVLQLIVNPEMGRITSFVVSLIQGAFLVGIERAYRWLIMLFLPLLAILVHLVMSYIWRPIVKRQNANLMARQRTNRFPIVNKERSIKEDH